MKKTFLIGAVIFFVAAPFLFGQTTKLSLPRMHLDYMHSNLFQILRDSINTDTILTLSKTDSALTPVKKKDKPFKMKKSPLAATLLSAVFPGAGQFYNHSYWKVPVIAGLVGYFGYEYFHYNNIYKDYRGQYAASQQQFPPEGDDNLKALREFNRTQRDNFVWYFLIIYVINLADAFVDAHLFDFDVSEEKISTLGITDRKASLKLHINF